MTLQEACHGACRMDEALGYIAPRICYTRPKMIELTTHGGSLCKGLAGSSPDQSLLPFRIRLPREEPVCARCLAINLVGL